MAGMLRTGADGCTGLAPSAKPRAEQLGCTRVHFRGLPGASDAQCCLRVWLATSLDDKVYPGTLFGIGQVWLRAAEQGQQHLVPAAWVTAGCVPGYTTGPRSGFATDSGSDRPIPNPGCTRVHLGLPPCSLLRSERCLVMSIVWLCCYYKNCIPMPLLMNLALLLMSCQ